MARSVSADEPDAIDKLVRDGWPDLRHLWNREARGYPPILKSKDIVIVALDIMPRKVWPPIKPLGVRTPALVTESTLQRIEVRIKTMDLSEKVRTEYVHEYEIEPEFFDVTGIPKGKLKITGIHMELWIDDEFSGNIYPDKEMERSFEIHDARTVRLEDFGSKIKLITEPIAESLDKMIAGLDKLPEGFKSATVTTWDDPSASPLEDIKRYALAMTKEDDTVERSMLSESELRAKLREMAADDRARRVGDEYALDGRDREIRRLTMEGKLKYEPTPVRRPRPPFPGSVSERRCAISINEATGKVSCACWNQERQWCEAMHVWLSSTSSTALSSMANQELRSISSRGQISGSVLLPIAPGYCLMQVNLGHRAINEARVSGVVVLSDAANPELTIDLSSSNKDTVDVALEMFRGYYRSFHQDFAMVNTVVQKIHNFHSTDDPKIKDANKVSRNPFRCHSPVHGVNSDRQLMQATIKPPHGASLESIILGNVYSLRTQKLCVHCNTNNYDFSGDVP